MTQENALQANDEELIAEEEDGETVCYCFDVPDTIIKKVIRNFRVKEVDEVTERCNAGGGCTSCHPDIEEMIEEFWDEQLEE